METLTATKTNTEIVQQAFADFGNGNIAGILNECTNDAVWATWNNAVLPYAKTFNGKAGIGEFFGALAATLDYTAFEPKEFYAVDNKVFAKVYQAAIVKATGKSYGHDCMMEFTFRNGKMSHFFAYVDIADQVQAFTK
jgi:ketosteroid isomerase-like protein